jgi:beta-galactosidase
MKATNLSAIAWLIALGAFSTGLAAAVEPQFVPPVSPRVTYNFNPGWRFIKEDVPDSEKPDLDDSKWDAVSTPHTYNDVDSFDQLISRGGEAGLYMGPATYRKHFKIPASARDGKIFLEFEGLRQAARFFVNGKPVGKYENGVTACGLDITDAVHFGDQENVLTVKVTNVTSYREEASGVGYQWASRDFNPNFGGLNRDVWLHVMGKIHQTLPLYENLKTSGVYVHATNFSVAAKTADVVLEAQVRNESGGQQTIALSAVVVDAEGVARATLAGETHDLASGETSIMKAAGPLAGVNFWTDRNPYLYEVYSILKVDDQVVDVNKVTTGFRKTDFKGGAGTGGVYLNDRFVYLRGYAIRSVNEWAALGGAYPDWLHDFSARLI